MFTPIFWKSLAERAIATAAESALGSIAIVQAALLMGGAEVQAALDGKQLQLYALGVGLSTSAAVLKGIVSAYVGDKGTPSLIEGGE